MMSTQAPGIDSKVGRFRNKDREKFLQKKWECGVFVLGLAVSWEKKQHLSVFQVAEISFRRTSERPEGQREPLRSDNGQFTLVEEIPPGTTDVGVA